MNPPSEQPPFSSANQTVAPELTGNEISGGTLWSSDFTPSDSGSFGFASDAISRVTELPTLTASARKK